MKMEHSKTGAQSIGCTVTGCRYNLQNGSCELKHIEVRPCRQNGGCTGRPDDESFCGSFAEGGR